MENTATPRAAARPALPSLDPTALDLMVRGDVVSVGYLDVERSLARARLMLAIDGDRLDGTVRPLPIAAYRALATRLGLHDAGLKRDFIREIPTKLPAGLTVSLARWTNDYARLTSLLLTTYRQQCEERIAVLVRGGAS